MDLFPVKQEKPVAVAAAAQRQQRQRLENLMVTQSSGDPVGSILESDLFRPPE